MEKRWQEMSEKEREAYKRKHVYPRQYPGGFPRESQVSGSEVSGSGSGVSGSQVSGSQYTENESEAGSQASEVRSESTVRPGKGKGRA